MAAAAGLFNHAMTATQALIGNHVEAADSSTTTSGSTGSDSSDDSSATISANDFLTLLVTEMQNQDPTADTDPNEYINQLVEVNSLEQLIDINQTLSTDLGGTATASNAVKGAEPRSGTGGISGTSANVAAAAGAGGVAGAATRLNKAPSPGHSAILPGGVGATSNLLAAPTAGNLSVPGAKLAAHRVAHALDGRTRAQPAARSWSQGRAKVNGSTQISKD